MKINMLCSNPDCKNIISFYPCKVNKNKYHFCSKKCGSEWRSKFRSGKNHPMYGKHHTDASKKKISESSRVPFEIKEMTPSIAETIGKYMGDGCVDSDQCFKFPSVDIDLIDETDRVLRTFVPENIPIYRYSCPGDKTLKGKQVYRLVIFNRNFADYLVKITNNKQRIPDEIINGSKEFKMAFLQGMMDSEGCIGDVKNKKCPTYHRFQISFGIASPLCYDIKQLFADLNIRTGRMLLRKSINEKRKDYYYFTINTFDYYNSGMRFSIGRKQERLNSYKPIFERHQKRMTKNKNCYKYH